MNHEQLQKEIENRIKRRERKKKIKMKVSGKNVLKLQKIIANKAGKKR